MVIAPFVPLFLCFVGSLFFERFFDRFLVRKPTRRNAKIMVFMQVLLGFGENGLFRIATNLRPIWEPFWQGFGSQTVPKSMKIAMKTSVRFSMRFSIDFWSLGD